ncbi:unnamed protein product [Choristocarpus tenellus]
MILRECLNTVDGMGRTAIMHAAMFDQLGCLQFLVDSGARLDAGDTSELTPLMLAAGRGHENCLRALLDVTPRADLDAADSLGCTAVHHACSAGEADALALIAACGANLNLPSGPLEVPGGLGGGSGLHPAHLAVVRGSSRCLEELSAWGADLEAKDGNGNTVLLLAVDHASQACVDHLLFGSPGGRPLVAVDRTGPLGRSPLHAASRRGRLALVMALLKAGADPAARDWAGATPLHLAAQFGHVWALEALLVVAVALPSMSWSRLEGADSCDVDHRVRGEIEGQGEEKMIYYGSMSVVDRGYYAGEGNTTGTTLPAHPRTLSSASSMASAQTLAGETTTFLAARGGHLEACRALREFGGLDPSTVNKTGVSPLLAGAWGGHREVVDLLAEAGGNVNLADMRGVTPAMVAAHAGNKDLLKALEAWGASLALTDAKGRTAALLATDGGHLECLAFIVEEAANEEANATVKMADVFGQTPLWVAASRGHLAIVRFLLVNEVATGRENTLGGEIGGVKGKGRCSNGSIASSSSINTLDTRDIEGRTTVRAAAEGGHVGCLRVLLEAGGDVQCPDDRGITPTLAACQAGQGECLRALAAGGADMGERDLAGNMAATFAAMGGHLGCLKILASLGAELDTPNEEGHTPVFAATMYEHPNCLAFLAQRGANLRRRDLISGNTPAMVAASFGRKACLSFLVKAAGPVALSDTNSEGLSPASFAALCGREGAISVISTLRDPLLLTHKDVRGCTPAHCAAVEGHVGCLRALAEGISKAMVGGGQRGGGKRALSAVNAARESPLHVAARAGQVRAAAYLMFEARVSPVEKNARGETCLWLAALHGELDTLRLFVRQGLDVNVPDALGRSPVHAAAMHGHVEALQVLSEADELGSSCHLSGGLKAGAEADDYMAIVGRVGGGEGQQESGLDVNAVDKEGATALHLAAAGGHVRAVSALLEAGANIQAADKRGLTASWHAVFGGEAEVLSLLASHGAVLDAAVSEGTTLAHLAAAKGFNTCLEVLCRNGVDLDAANQNGTTPAMFAAKSNYVEILEILARHNCDFDIVDFQSVSPMFFAAQEGHLAALEFLLGRGADPCIPRADGTTPLIIAAQNGHLQCVGALLIPPPHAATVKTTTVRASILKVPPISHVSLPLSNDVSEVLNTSNGGPKAVSNALQLQKNSVVRDGTGGRGPPTKSAPATVRFSPTMMPCNPKATAARGLEVRTSSGYTALSMAAVGGQPRCVVRLLEAGANIDAADGKGRTPIYLAAAAGDAAMCSLLVRRGANLRSRAHDGVEPAFAAASRGHEAAVEAILRGGLDPDEAVDGSGVPLSRYLFVLRGRARKKAVNSIAPAGVDAASPIQGSAGEGEAKGGLVSRKDKGMQATTHTRKTTKNQRIAALLPSSVARLSSGVVPSPSSLCHSLQPSFSEPFPPSSISSPSVSTTTAPSSIGTLGRSMGSGETYFRGGGNRTAVTAPVAPELPGLPPLPHPAVEVLLCRDWGGGVGRNRTGWQEDRDYLHRWAPRDRGWVELS